MKLDNKGFAVSIILYSMIAIITIIFLLILSIYSTSIHNKISQAERIKEKISDLNTLTNKILQNNQDIKNDAELDKISNTKDGVYKSIVTTSGQPTYYFRGITDNNYVRFAGKIWRIVRINEDKTVRLVLNELPSTSLYSSSSNILNGMYYSNNTNNSEIKKALDDWYNSNIDSKADSKIASGNYFCEQNKVRLETTNADDNNAKPFKYNNEEYIANFKCRDDGNGYGFVNSKVGLLTYDEVVSAGGYYNVDNDITNSNNPNGYYLDSNNNWWTMSPSNPNSIWYVTSTGAINVASENTVMYIRPVINLKNNVIVSKGTGKENDPYTIE